MAESGGEEQFLFVVQTHELAAALNKVLNETKVRYRVPALQWPDSHREPKMKLIVSFCAVGFSSGSTKVACCTQAVKHSTLKHLRHCNASSKVNCSMPPLQHLRHESL
jgi:hypothetical protein